MRFNDEFSLHSKIKITKLLSTTLPNLKFNNHDIRIHLPDPDDELHIISFTEYSEFLKIARNRRVSYIPFVHAFGA